MLINFFYSLRESKLPVSLNEFLALLEALEANLAFADLDEFYLLARTCLVKDEKFYDRFDRAFGVFFEGLENLDDFIEALIPDEWVRSELEKYLSDEEKAKIKSLGGLEELIEQFKKRLEEQQKRHQGGNKWVGTGGTSPFGNDGYNPEGIRVGGQSRHKRAVKVWEQRQYKNLDDNIQLGIRDIKVALRRLRKFARTGAADQLDLDDTIRSTARNAGLLDIKMVPERHNAVKVLLFFDVGGSMNPHVSMCEELFSAARSEFKHMEYFYFHNCLYESVWRDNFRRHGDRISTNEVFRTYARDYRVIVIGDASMAPYEITHPGGSVEHFNAEAGGVWIQRLVEHYPRSVWLNPVPEAEWDYTHTIGLIRRLMEDRMYPLTLAGLEAAMTTLAR